METNDMPIGVANCLRIHIFTEPNAESDIVCKVRYLTELAVDIENSTTDFYKVYTVNGAEGYCRKDLVTIK
jgi:hypothetical protein